MAGRHLVRAPRYLLVGCLLLCAALASGPAASQDRPPDPQPQTYPQLFEVTERHRALAEAADRAEAEIEALGLVDDLELELREMRQRLAEMHAQIATLVEAEYMRPERISRIRDRAIAHEVRLEALRQRVAERVREVGEMRTRWTERRDFWRGWQQAVTDDPGFTELRGRFEQAVSRAEEVIATIDVAMPELMQLQEDAAGLRAQAEQGAERVAMIREGRRHALRERTEPVLFTSGHLSELTLETWRDWRPWTVVQASLQEDFLSESAGLILLHVLLGVLLVFVARQVRVRGRAQGDWAGLLRRPRALALFAATAIMTPQYALPPPLWDVAMWALLAASGSVLATSLIGVGSVRRMVYFFAALYPIFLLAEALQTPPPIFRLLLASAALVGIVGFLALLRGELAKEHEVRYARWSLGIGAAVLSVVFVAEVLGFYVLARWILHAAVTTAFLAFLVVFLVVLARGAIGSLVRIEAKGRLGFLRDIGVPFVRQVLRLFQVVLVVVAALHVLDAWELATSPSQSWERITTLGFTFAGIEITVGRIIAAAVLLYLAIGFSWLLRTFARSEVYPRWELERGVGDSINTLLHYFLITIGFFIALGALGVELQNFAIIVGALGVGIGFGLQNIVNNFISGLILLFERPVRVGDTIVLNDELGTIEKIGLRSTTVLTFDQAEVIVPNGDLISEKVTNWTLTNPVARLVIPVGVAYGSDVTRVLELLSEAADQHEEVLLDPPPQVLFREFGESALEFELRVWVQELRLRLKVRSEILKRIERLFRDNGIEIPFPQRDLHVRSIDEKLLKAASGTGSPENRGGNAPGDA